MKERLLLIFSSLILFGSHAQNSDIEIPMTPPGTVKIRENFYADKTEMRNINYREYMYWNLRVFGSTSPQYLNSLPDTNVWLNPDTLCRSCVRLYYRYPPKDEYPMVGVSYEQAAAYCKWRSDRVYEYLLVKKKIIRPLNNQDSNNYFSIEKYINGKYMNYSSPQRIPYPVYRLPTLEEWEMIATNTRKMKKQPVVKGSSFNDSIPEKVTYGSKTNKGLYNIRGNVAEMTSVKGIAKGGSFRHSFLESDIKHIIRYNSPQAWLGCRFVCSWDQKRYNYPNN